MSVDNRQLSSKTGHVAVQHSNEASTGRHDIIRIRDLKINVPISNTGNGTDQQGVLVTLAIVHDTRSTAATDDLARSINYASVSETVSQVRGTSSVLSLEALLERVCTSCYGRHPEVQELSVRANVALSTDITAGIEIHSSRSVPHAAAWRSFLEGLECQTIIGVNPEERDVKQPVLLNVTLVASRSPQEPLNLRGLAATIMQGVTDSSYLTLEALASYVARIALSQCTEPSCRVTVRASKPHALRPVAEAAEVEVSRTLEDYQRESAVDASEVTKVSPSERARSKTPTFASLLASVLGRKAPVRYPHRAAIALGANLGDRCANIELALRLLDLPPEGMQTPRAVVVDTSFMYETAPMYVTDQPKFINCACMIETDMGPLELLSYVKYIEATVGRVTSFRNGPRAIDLDILTYDSEVFDSRPATERGALDNLAGQLVVPHPRIAEREFVLRPLRDMIPEHVHPTLHKSVRTLFAELLARSGPDVAPMYKVTPFPRYGLPTQPPSRPPSPSLSDVPPVPPTAAYWTYPVAPSKAKQRRTTYIMGTLNATPDSFSDGSKHNTIPAALAYAKSAVAGGAAIIDVGGYSTRPRAAWVSPQEETSRVVPIIEAIRAIGQDEGDDQALRSKTANVLISVDTFRSEVAEAAVRAGANCINDVYAFVGNRWPLDASSAEDFLEMRRARASSPSLSC
ncbi:hypothetical protein EVJ58_g3008 [Rhodofomes roseus]|uniref:2-amino-4-hydroxy-6-hydroxymethyldihydropteridine diphosphokinase n=1 Tax=Rhodofomes roseus TaxID=34475 RepID=A0A4Y9YPV1_9APHY|nr:hypothetical protein EVJ58_g3008 [Rhodofomes roseus]